MSFETPSPYTIVMFSAFSRRNSSSAITSSGLMMGSTHIPWEPTALSVALADSWRGQEQEAGVITGKSAGMTQRSDRTEYFGEVGYWVKPNLVAPGSHAELREVRGSACVGVDGCLSLTFCHAPTANAGDLPRGRSVPIPTHLLDRRTLPPWPQPHVEQP